MMRTLTILASLLPALAVAQMTVGAPLRGKPQVVNDGPGHQTNPRVSGARVTYTHQDGSGSQIRYHDLLTGEDRGIPYEGGFDVVSDVFGDSVVFTRIDRSIAIYHYDVRQGGRPELLAPRPEMDRRAASVGRRTVAWQDLGYTSRLAPEIAAYGLDTGVLTRLTEDGMLDRTPSVGEDGKTVVWSKCAIDETSCDIWQAREVAGGYEVLRLTGPEGEEFKPDTDGKVVVYVSRRLTGGVEERDIAWQPVGGGPEQRLVLPGVEANPNVSGSLIAFERRASPDGSFDIAIYDLRTHTLYTLTDTPENEMLSDISVSEDGQVRVVWSVMGKEDLDVYAYTFRLPERCEPVPSVEDPDAVCERPGARWLLGKLEVGRVAGRPEEASMEFEATGTGVLCVDNGFGGEPATAGWVSLGEDLSVGPDSFRHRVERVSRVVPLQGRSVLSARLAGEPGSAFRVRVYGELVCGGASEDFELEQAELRYGTPVQPEEVDAAEVRIFSRYFVPAGYEGPSSSALEPLPLWGGCSTGGGTVALLGVLLFAAWLWRSRVLAVGVRPSRRR
jgi:Tol biopolymer transport system component